MRILVYPHDLGVGGSQLNAIDLAAAVRDRGHEVTVFGRPGPLVTRVHELGLPFVEAPTPGRRPSPAVARAIRELVDSQGLDVVHGYEWPPALEAALATRGRPGTVAVTTIMSMSVPGFIPRSRCTVVGTEQIAAHEQRRGRSRVAVIEPPVDIEHDAVSTAAVEQFRARWSLDPARPAVVSVARFAHELKLEGTLAAIEAVATLTPQHRPQLVLVGDGPARAEVEARVARTREVSGADIILTGQLDDPRPAYAAADVMLGMGGSALRALAFGKPLVVQGENGFWQLLTPETAPLFLWQGWYGVGSDATGGPTTLAGVLGPLLDDGPLRAELGRFGQELVRSRFALTRAARLQEDCYRRALDDPRPFSTPADAAALLRYVGYYVGKRVRRALGTERTDDFNARPVAGRMGVPAGRR